MTRDDAKDAKLTTGDVEKLLGLSQDTIARIPKELLDYWQTPGGGQRRHRRYLRADVERYAREVLGREIGGVRTEGGDPL